MNLVAISRLKIKKPSWVIANLVETTQSATENVLNAYDRVKTPNKEHEKGVRSGSKQNEQPISSLSTSSKLQRDIFGATILPSNLSFDNMKKLSMNHIKLEEIPLVDENNVAEVLAAEKIGKLKEAEALRPEEKKKGKGQEVESGDSSTSKYDYMACDADMWRADPFEDIPGPRLFESVTSTLQYMARHISVHFLLKMLQSGSNRLFRKYGPIMRLPGIVGGRILLVTRPEHISEINYQDRRPPASSSLDTLECSRLRRHGKKKKCQCETDWEMTRHKISTILSKDKEKYFDGLEESGSNLLKRIRSVRSRENEVGVHFDSEVNRWSLECLFQILFDKSSGLLNQEVKRLPSKNEKLLMSLQEATRSLDACESGFQLWRFMSTSAAASLDNSCNSVETILSHYIHQAQKDLENKVDGSLTVTETMLHDGMTKADIMTNLLDALLIGMNAITTTLSFLLYYLARNPRTQTELFQEIKGILPEKYSRLEYNELCSLKFLPACVKETIRLKMPIPILTRYLNRDIVISNFQIPRGTFVVMAAQVGSLKEENYEKPREFRPRRWLLSENKQNSPSIPLSAYSQSPFKTDLPDLSVMACASQIIRNFKVEFNHGSLKASTIPLASPTKPLKFSFFEREQ